MNRTYEEWVEKVTDSSADIALADMLADWQADIIRRMKAEHALNKRIAELEAEIDQLTARWRQERQVDKWTPVSERLPENWKSVLTIDISNITRGAVTAFYNPDTSLWSTHFSCDLWVTHWMPLPELPIMYGKVCEE